MQLSICVIIIMMMISKLAMHFSQKIHFLYVEVDMRVTYLVLKFKCVNNCFASNMLLIFKWWNSKVYTYIGIDFTIESANLLFFKWCSKSRLVGVPSPDLSSPHQTPAESFVLLTFTLYYSFEKGKLIWCPDRTKENKIRVWTVSDKAVVCEQWVLRPLCVNGDTAGVCEQWVLRPVCVYGDRCVWTISVKATVCEQSHARCVRTASDTAALFEQSVIRPLRVSSDRAIVRARGQTDVGQR
jgi:hypothetical protein